MSPQIATITSAPDFDLVIESSIPLPERLPYRNLAELVFRGDSDHGEPGEHPVLLGTVGARMISLPPLALQHAVLEVIASLEARGLHPGDTVCLVRMPRTSEILAAVTIVALAAWGARVLLPMFVERGSFRRWVRTTGAKAVLWSRYEVMELGSDEADRETLLELERALAGLGVPSICLVADLELPAVIDRARQNASRPDQARVAELLESTSADAQCLILTTSGTSGKSKLVCYRQAALLRSCQAWELAGLFDPAALGGRCLSLLLCHSMGIRALWNAVWTRDALCLVTPEWFAEHPERVRGLLVRMQPQHVTGGPGVFRTLLELARVFPNLKGDCLRHLRCAVSSGAPFDAELATRLRVSLGIPLHDAFGMTETMQVCSTLLDEGSKREGRRLGLPLPGVRLGLRRVVGAGGASLFRLFVQSESACEGYLADDGTIESATQCGWLATGDVVELRENRLSYVGRENDDFVKDGFGVKVPASRLAELYRGLAAPIAHVELFPLREEPGLAALVFVSEPDQPCRTVEGGLVVEARTIRRVRSLIEARLEVLRDELDEMELRHLSVRRFACVAVPVPRTPKGNPSRGEIVAGVGPLVHLLVGPWVGYPWLIKIHPEAFRRDSAARLMNPRRAELLRIARLDKSYDRALGDRLWYREGGDDVEVVDFVGGYGANLLGHRHPAVVDAAKSFLDGAGAPIGDQASRARPAAALARALSLAVGRHTGNSYVVRLGSTGAEATEMAIAHAFLELQETLRKLVRDQRSAFGSAHPDEVAVLEEAVGAIWRDRRPVLLAVRNAFHGHTLAARSVLGAAKPRTVFAALQGVKTVFLSPDEPDEVDAAVGAHLIELPVLTTTETGVQREVFRIPAVFASIAEPILGEGGVRCVAPSVLKRLSEQTFPLIADEIQCGLGRTGSLLASQGVAASYYLFGKALGGGIAKVSAAVIERERYVAKFDEYYASTFAGDPFSSAVATRVLEVIEHQGIPALAAARGQALAAALEPVRAAHPSVIAAVRGRGLMLGVELDTRALQGSVLLRSLATHELFGYLAAGYLLHAHRVRVMPTLSAPNSLRVEPSAFIDDLAIEQLRRGLDDLCGVVERLDIRQLVSFLVADDEMAEEERPRPVQSRGDLAVEQPADGARQVGFIAHFVHPESELAAVEPTLAGMTPSARRALFHRVMQLLEARPLVVYARNLLGGRLHFTYVVLAADVATLEEMHRSGERETAIERVQEAVELLARRGCTVVALGAYTSIITRDGEAIAPPAGTRVTSGNAFTAAAGCRRILDACRGRDIDPAALDSKLGVVGATGNIGRAMARRLLTAPGGFHRGLLVGRRREALEGVRASLLAAAAETGHALELAVSTDLSDLVQCNVVAAATNTNAPILHARHLAQDRAVIVGDVSVPGALSDDARAMPLVQAVLLADVVPVPGQEDFAMSTHTPRGTAFCCAAEAMILALAPGETRDLRLVGAIDPHSVDALERLAAELGFLPGQENR